MTSGARSSCLAPIARRDARVLILGSLPGAESLRRQQYYAHAQNAFWPIMGELVGARPELPYAARTARLVEAGIALWDVCAEAERAGSLDAAIRAPVANDLAGFLAVHPDIAVIGFNGATAATLFARRVRPTLGLDLRPALVALPSTSPAHARMTRADKVAAWRGLLAAR